MHFRVRTGAFTFVFVFLSLLSMASPLSPRTNVVVNGLDERQLDIVASKQSSSIHHSHHKCDFPVIVDIAAEVIHDIIEIFTFQDDAHAAERYFTQETVKSLGLTYPAKNRLVFHDQKSTYNFCMSCQCLLCSRPFLLTSFSAGCRPCTPGT